MSYFQLSLKDYAKIQKSLTACLGKNETRESLMQIHLVVKDNKIRFQSCNGFSACNYCVTNYTSGKNTLEDMDVLFYPIKWDKTNKNGEIRFELEDGTLLKITITSKNNRYTTTYVFNQKDYYPYISNLDSIIHPYGSKVVYFNGVLLSNILKNINGKCNITIPEKQTDPLYITIEDKSQEFILLPMRNFTE